MAVVYGRSTRSLDVMRTVHVVAVIAAVLSLVAATQSVQRGELGVWALFVAPPMAVFGVHLGCFVLIVVGRNVPVAEWGAVAAGLFEAKKASMTPNNTLELTVDYRGPHPRCQPIVGWLCMRQAAMWSAAQLGR